MSNLYWNKFGAKSALSGFRNVGHPPVHLSSVHFVTIINVEDASHEVSGCFVFVIVYCFSPFSANFLSRTLLQVFLLPFLLFHRLDKRNSVRLCTPARKPVIVLTRFIRIWYGMRDNLETAFVFQLNCRRLQNLSMGLASSGCRIIRIRDGDIVYVTATVCVVNVSGAVWSLLPAILVHYFNASLMHLVVFRIRRRLNPIGHAALNTPLWSRNIMSLYPRPIFSNWSGSQSVALWC